MGRTTDLLVGLAEHLHAAGVGVWSPDSGSGFPPGATGIVTKVMPTKPDRVIVLSPYLVTGDLHGETVQGVQVRTRAPGLPTAVDDLDDEVYQLLHGVEDVTWGGVHVALCRRASQVSMGRDGDGRFENSSNYYLTIARPTAHTR